MSPEKLPLDRGRFMQSAAATGAGLRFLRSGILFGANRPRNKLNSALIGGSGRAKAHYDGLAGENVVAICDVDANNLTKAKARFPGAPRTPTGANASSKRTSTPFSAAPPTITMRSSPSRR